MDIENQILELKDGRKLGFAEYGDLEGIAVFHFNGSGGSRLERPADAGMLKELGIRYISTDRPGHGNSSPKSDRELLDWPEDVAAIADHLDIDQFHVLGWSAGGPHALACAYKLPSRVISGALVSALGPPNRPEPYKGYTGFLKLLMIWGRKYPKIVYVFRGMAAKQINRESERTGEKFVKSLPVVDRVPFENPLVKEMLISDIKEGYKQGGKGPARDDIIINSPWKFDIRNIRTHFDIWQGDSDKNVPANQGMYQAEILPDNSFHLLSNKGHMFLLEEWRNVLSELIKKTENTN